MNRISIGLATAGVLALAVAGMPLVLPHGAAVEAAFESPRPLVVDARPIAAFHPSEPTRKRFGGLEFVGGLVLSSRDKAFGGLSGLRTLDAGRRLVFVGDEGTWVTARLETDATGRPTAVVDARIAPLLDERGHPFHGKQNRDAESLTIRRSAGGLEARVGFEHRHRVLSYRIDGTDPSAFATAHGLPVTMPVEIGRLPPNEGLEALADAPSGALIAIAETAESGTGANPGWIVGGHGAGRFHLETTDGYAVTDAAFLPSGDLLVLERRLSLVGTFGARLVRVAAGDLAAGRVVRPTPVWQSEGGDEIDNMEGLAVDTAPDGATLVTLVSDDNFFWLERTLLLRFRLVEETAKTPPG